MILFWYAAFGFVVALPISLALGRNRRRQFVLALACPAVLATLVIVAVVRGCPPNAHECSAGFTLFIGGLLGGCLTIGWLLGIAMAVAIRRVWAGREGQPRPGSSESHGVR